MIRLIILFGIAALGPGIALAGVATTAASRPSFDCRHVGGLAELAVCGDVTLGRYDRAVTAAYRQALAGSDAKGPREMQRGWIVERNACADIACLRRSYESRLESLFESVSDTGPYAYHRVDRTGFMTMLPLGADDWAFHLNAFHQGLTPASVNVGDAVGVVHLAGGSGTFRNELCTLTIRRAGTGWSADTHGGDCGAGANVVLGGLFTKR